MRCKRKKIWIDKFQTRLSLSIALYFAIYQLGVWALIAIGKHLTQALEGPAGNSGQEGGLGWIVFLTLFVGVLGTVFIYDVVHLSHRFVGPLVRFRKSILAITAGEEVDMVSLRKGDYLQEMKNEFNAMLKALEERGVIAVKEGAAKENETPAATPASTSSHGIMTTITGPQLTR